jgi:hypothetical protein
MVERKWRGGNGGVQEAGFRVQVLPWSTVIPAQAGIHVRLSNMDSRCRGNDGLSGST